MDSAENRLGKFNDLFKSNFTIFALEDAHKRITLKNNLQIIKLDGSMMKGKI